MSAESFRFVPYAWSGGQEWLLSRDPSNGPQVLLIAPLFEELNFTRTLLAQIGRALAAAGVGTWLPDLPGTADSERSLSAVAWEDWRSALRDAGEAMTALTGTRPFTCAFRGGALLDDAVDAAGRWRYAPVAGEALLRQLRRAQLVADREAGVAPAEGQGILEYAGYPLSADLRLALNQAEPAPVADREIPALPDGSLWRRAEPAGDIVLAEQLAGNIVDWIATCASH